MLSKKRLDEIRRQWCITSPRPWRMAASDAKEIYVTVPVDANGNHVCQSFATKDDVELLNNGIFIADAHEYVPDLLDDIWELRQMVKAEVEKKNELLSANTNLLAAYDRLCGAIRQVEPFALHIVERVIADGVRQIVKECQVCRARFRSWETKDTHRDGCVFKC